VTGEPPAVDEAYHDTDYIARDGDGEAVAQAGRLNPALDALLDRHGARQGVFITAWNPRSERCDHGRNDAANARLAAMLDAGGLRHLPHTGRARDGGWEEQGFLVLDLAPAEALALAASFGQNAVAWACVGQPLAILYSCVAVEGQ
jgi:hypothetical protein